MIGSILIAPLSFILPRTVIFWLIRFQSIHALINLKYLVNLEVEFRGTENIPKFRKYLIASKHQSLAEGMFLNYAIEKPSIVAKRELLYIPIVGLCFKKANFIYVNRTKGETPIETLVRTSKQSMEKDPRPLLIFPEGTRTPIGEKKPYKYGITALYKGLNVPCLPVAVNTGYFWPRRKFLRYPGKMIIEFLKPIEPGLEAEDFSKILEQTIEKRSHELLLEAQNQSTDRV
ncbi:1-acyl-sn-glycerol-3-phosphate acyltransferase [Pelagibacterales bacterium]|jgi:1-acyl-sn-glycerol-3-phosphate acyltransferase|nr:1-acyl-sn-glycerol-3-phosphate acyltransferase [Pelagibacteraceae bacterium]MDC1303144.1 1-acyl-sn-glycerol-3-phosphate acyltransferase [Pelagibacterales bacterium]|tara:strand:- start:7999 stop:8691 length:693 start_codon:yes stop_codon:yes gene_type:complete